MKRSRLGALLCIALTAIMPVNAMAADYRASDEVAVDAVAANTDAQEDAELIAEEEGLASEDSAAGEDISASEDSAASEESSDEEEFITGEEDTFFEEEESEDTTAALEEEAAEEDAAEEEASSDTVTVPLDTEVDSFMLGSPSPSQLLYGDDVAELDLDEEVDLLWGSTTSTVTAKFTYGQSEARTMLAMINDLRTNPDKAWYWDSSDSYKVTVSNLSPLTYDYALEKSAMQRAAECAIGYSHTRPNGQDCWSVATDTGYVNFMCGENIAAGYRSAESVFEGWAEEDDSYSGQGHRRNMLNRSASAVGIGHVYFNGTHYWVQEFSYTNQNPTPTTANDKETSTSVQVLNSQVTVYANTSEVMLEVGSTYSLKKEGTAFTHANTWPSGARITASNLIPTFSMASTQYASLSNGLLTGKKLGSTTLTSTYFNGQTARRTISVKNHNYETVTVNATCTSSGYTKKTCSICGDTSTTTIAALGHDYYDSIYYPASQYSSGAIRHYCNRCGYYSYETIPINYTGLIKMNGQWCYFQNGARNTTYTGMVNYGGKWYYVTNGVLVWGKELMCQYMGTWYYVKNSTFDNSYSGMYKWNGTWYYLTNGVLKWGVTGMTKYKGTWYYIENSTFRGNYTGLVYYNGTWYYVQKSVLKWGENTCVYYGGKWYYVNNSKVDFSYTGYTTYGGKRYKVVNGVVQV